jgi:hypothetical protein
MAGSGGTGCGETGLGATSCDQAFEMKKAPKQRIVKKQIVVLVSGLLDERPMQCILTP